MSYQVLARKWRPKSFESMVGQAHVVRTLTNALNQHRLHHAYLFTGTRGVGKTTVARIIAKCLNCETGVSANPCHQCTTCQEIDTGRCIDLIEVDAASRTKVEDTRELLDNVPYAPTCTRYKVYLIDEVHMLSGHSFNALLKTLEEPPPHVKFLLATTDPQKLPVTVLSRCLQFHLKNLSPELITQRLTYILKEENITSEEKALIQLAHAADGSMRDALSLLDQAIAYGNGNVTFDAVKNMLGIIDSDYIYHIMDALIENAPIKLLTLTQQLAEQSVDFSQLLEGLISVLHHIAIVQIIPEWSVNDEYNAEKIHTFAKTLTGQTLQLFYQIALMGRRDLPLVPIAKNGFEMILLRMLAFYPLSPPVKVDTAVSTPAPQSSTPPTEIKISANNDSWQDLLAKLNLRGALAIIASHCTLEKFNDNNVSLLLNPAQAPLLNKKHIERFSEAFSDYFKKPITVNIHVGKQPLETPALLQERAKTERQNELEQSLTQDQHVKTLIETFNAKIMPNSITSNDA